MDARTFLNREIGRRWPALLEIVPIDAVFQEFPPRLCGVCTEWDSFDLGWLMAEYLPDFPERPEVPDGFFLLCLFDQGMAEDLCILIREGERRFFFRDRRVSFTGGRTDDTDARLAQALLDWKNELGHVGYHGRRQI